MHQFGEHTIWQLFVIVKLKKNEVIAEYNVDPHNKSGDQ